MNEEFPKNINGELEYNFVKYFNKLNYESKAEILICLLRELNNNEKECFIRENIKEDQICGLNMEI